MERENNEGNIEYKLKLIDLSELKIEKIATQMKYRCRQGFGECIYLLGISDSGNIIGINDEDYEITMKCINNALYKNNYIISTLTKKLVDENKYIYELLIREQNHKKYIDIKVAVAGSVDAGKSTFLGVLISGEKDNGKGNSRLNIFNFPHEIISGRTSSIGHQICGFDKNGINISFKNNRKLSWPDIVKNSIKIINFYDLAGHEKYLKTTIYGLCNSSPDLVIIMVAANRGVLKMTKEHIFLCVALQIPFCIVISKIDLVVDTPNILKDTNISINKILKDDNIRRKPFRIKSSDDIVNSIVNLHSNIIVPIFKISNTTLEGVDFFNKFLNLIPKKHNDEKKTDMVEMFIDCIWNVPNIGTVVGGFLNSGFVKTGDKLYIGPINNLYKQITIRSIHCKRVPLQEVEHGTYTCFALKGIYKQDIKKGCVIISDKSQQILCERITAEIEVFETHSTNIKEGYTCMLSTANIKTPCIIEKIENKISDRDVVNDDCILRSNDKATITLKIMNGKKYIKNNNNILLNEGLTKLFGHITNVF